MLNFDPLAPLIDNKHVVSKVAITLVGGLICTSALDQACRFFAARAALALM